MLLYVKQTCLISVMSDSLQPHGLQPTKRLCPWGFSRQEYQSELSCPPPGDLPDPGIKPRSPALQADSLPSELPGKPKNTGVDSLSLLQGIFPTQESNRGLLCQQADSSPSELPGKPQQAEDRPRWGQNRQPMEICCMTQGTQTRAL